LCAGQFILLIIQTHILWFPLVSLSLSLSLSFSLPFFPPVLGKPRLTLFARQLDQAIFPSIPLYDHQGVNLSAKTYSFEDVAPVNQDMRAKGFVHVFWGFWFFLFFAVMGFGLSALRFLGRTFYHMSHSASPVLC
jgi:hypothetical protein